MLVKEPKYRKTLNAKQDRLLKVIAKFRFITVPLLSELDKKNKSTIYESLYVLHSQGYVGKHYDKSYRLRGRPAEYYLDNKGIRYLKENFDRPTDFLRNLYKDKRASEGFIDRCLLNVRIYTLFKYQYPNKYDIFSQTELLNFSYFVRPLPDMYLRAERRKQSQKSFVLDVFESGTPRFLYIRRLRQHQDQDGYEWNNETYGPYPDVLLVAPHDQAEQKLISIIEDMMDAFEVYTTTMGRLLNEGKNKVIWKSAFPEDNAKRYGLDRLNTIE